MEHLFRSVMLWCLGRLPEFLAKKVYGPARIAEALQIDLRPSGDQFAIDFKTAEGSIWLSIRNGSPFPVQLDRASVEPWCSGRVGKMVFLDRTEIAPGKAKDVL